MFKTILLPVVSSGVGTSSFGVAVALARMFVGHIDLLYVRPEAVTAGAAFGGAVIPGMLEQLQAAADRRHGDSMHAYLDACGNERIPTDIVGPAVGRVTARWHRAIGEVADCVAGYAQASDITVVERGSDLLRSQAMRGALFESGKPVLIPGLRPPSLDTVLVAWKPTREAGRSVGAALPFLAQAKRVVIAGVSEGRSVRSNELERLATMLRRHQPCVETLLLEPGPLEVSVALLQHAYRIGAGLMVMGAYSRSRLRELILGGVTEGVLDASEVPVVMAH